MNKRAFSLRRRLLISLLLMLALGFAALAVSLFDTRDELRRISLFLQAEEIARDFQPEDSLDTLPPYYAGGEMSYSLYSAQGKLLQASANLASPRRLRPSRPEDELALFKQKHRSGYVVSVSVTLPSGEILMVAKRDQRERELIGALLQTRMWRSLLLWLPVCALGLLLIAWLIHWTLRPVRQAADRATTLGPAQPELRLPVTELPKEIRPLAQAVNQSLDRLMQAYRHEQQLVADAAHQLRTPLAVMSLRLQTTQHHSDKVWDLLREDIAHLQRLVSQWLSLARKQEQATELVDQTALAPLCRRIMGDLWPLFEQAGRELQFQDDSLQDSVLACEADLAEAIVNVLDNALTHGVGTVTLQLHNPSESSCAIDIKDQGPALDEHAGHQAFERFHKQDSVSTGAGLGLTIVRQILLRHGGQAQFLPGPYCTLRLLLPLATQAPPASDKKTV
ncbi:MAG TPA: two-component sensor histidine kinase [Alcaligenes faecalis]|nr:two-component sensor histidine kinase [Alcaligenes faecalis]